MSSASPSVEVIVLGTGTSHGIPMIGCDCPVCSSQDPRDKRSRVSIVVRMDGQRILVDTAPELRLQCVANGISAVDAVLFTHHHADHVAGLDDLRRFNWLLRRAVPCYGTPRTLAGLKRMFPYALESAPDSPHSRPKLQLQAIGADPFTVGTARIVPIPLLHGRMPVMGFRFGPFAYCTDCSHIPEDSMDLLRDLDVFILDGLRRTPHPAHFSIEEAVEAARAVGARQTYFTHIAHELGHRQTDEELPAGMALAYDGQRIVLPERTT